MRSKFARRPPAACLRALACLLTRSFVASLVYVCVCARALDVGLPPASVLVCRPRIARVYSLTILLVCAELARTRSHAVKTQVCLRAAVVVCVFVSVTARLAHKFAYERARANESAARIAHLLTHRARNSWKQRCCSNSNGDGRDTATSTRYELLRLNSEQAPLMPVFVVRPERREYRKESCKTRKQAGE